MRYYIYICAFIHVQSLLYICTAKKPVYFMPRYYPKPTGYVHVGVCSIGRSSGSIEALIRRYSGSIKALLRLYQHAFIHVYIYIHTYIHTYTHISSSTLLQIQRLKTRKRKRRQCCELTARCTRPTSQRKRARRMRQQRALLRVWTLMLATRSFICVCVCVWRLAVQYVSHASICITSKAQSRQANHTSKPKPCHTRHKMFTTTYTLYIYIYIYISETAQRTCIMHVLGLARIHKYIYALLRLC